MGRGRPRRPETAGVGRFLLWLALTATVLAAPVWVRQDCGGGLSIEFPKKPKVSADGRSYSADSREWSYSFDSSAVADGPATLKKLPDQLKRLANDRHGKLVSSRKVSKGPFTGLEFRNDGRMDRLEGQWLVGEGRLVQVNCGHRIGDFPDARRFLDSLKAKSSSN